MILVVTVIAVNDAIAQLTALLRHQWAEAARQCFQLFCSEEEAYRTSRLERDRRAPPLLWRSLLSVLGRNRDTAGVTVTIHRAEWFKKSGLDSEEVANFHPVSNMSFLSKVTESVVTFQPNVYMTKNGLLPHYQSSFNRNGHAAHPPGRSDNRQVILLATLNLSAAFEALTV